MSGWWIGRGKKFPCTWKTCVKDEKRHMIFEEYTEFSNNFSIEQVKEMMKADIERKVGAYNSCYRIIIGGLSS